MIFSSFLLLYSHVVGGEGGGKGEGLFRLSKLGVRETIFDWLKCVEGILIRAGAISLCKQLRLLAESMLTIGRTTREKRGS